MIQGTELDKGHIHIHKYLLNTYYVSGIDPGPGDVVENKRGIETYTLVVGDKNNTSDRAMQKIKWQGSDSVTDSLL